MHGIFRLLVQESQESVMRVIGILAAFLITAPAFAQGITPYKYVITHVTVTDLQTLGGYDSFAYDINDLGDVVGSSDDAANKQRAFVFLDGQMYNIHAPGDSPAFTYAEARAINNSRVVVGVYHTNGIVDRRPFYYYPGIWLSPMPMDASPGTPNSQNVWVAEANAINDYDYIAGAAINTNPNPSQGTLGICHEELAVWWYGASYNPAGLFCIPDPDYDGEWQGQGIRPAVNDINNSNNMVGTDAGKTPQSMFLWKAQQQSPVAVPAPPAFPNQGGPFGIALGLNDKNFVVGSFGHTASGSTNGSIHAFLWNGVAATSTDLGLLPGGTASQAFEINEQNMVVGDADRTWTYGGQSHSRSLAFIWHSNFGMVALPGLSYQGVAGAGSLNVLIPRNCQSRSINDRKENNGLVQVAGSCVTSTGKWHAVRWDITVNRVSAFPL
jgi:probable HAF family extracellular repeat protein